MKIKTIAISATIFVFLGGVIGVQQYISSQITSKVEKEMPSASGVSASVPLADVPSNLTSDSIKSAAVSYTHLTLPTKRIV